MIRYLFLLTLVSFVPAVGAAHGQALDGRMALPDTSAGHQKAFPVQYEYREAESYIDQYGREIIWDPQTGRVIAIVPRGERRYVNPSERRAARRRELGRDDVRTERAPLGERLRRELEVHLGLREPQEDGFDRDGREPPYTRPRDRFPDAPRLPDPGPQDSVERTPLDEPGAADDELGVGDDAQIASAPDDGADAASQPIEPGVGPALGGRGASKDVAKIQVLLDRAGLSPGVIDGRMGDNVNKAISAYKEKTGKALRTYDPQSIDAALDDTGGGAFSEYTITAMDAAGPYVASVPADYGEKARLERLSYSSTAEMLAERFHMDEAYLKALSPGANFERPGTVIKVVNIGQPVDEAVSRIIADKGRKQVRAYGVSGRLVAAYPATIGSADTPSPTGIVTVERIAFDPEYTYNPTVNFKQGQNDKVLTIPPGPNGPVGSIWIALSKPTYGIHGTPDPNKIGKTFSHGCVRLTNWDATELAKLVSKGVTVEFVE